MSTQHVGPYLPSGYIGHARSRPMRLWPDTFENCIASVKTIAATATRCTVKPNRRKLTKNATKKEKFWSESR